MTKVITYGTYDLLHYGHIRLLERAKELGDYLIVGVTADDFDKARGKINTKQSVIDRVEAVRALGIADEIIVEEYAGQKIDDIKKYDVDIFAIGSDWKGKFDYLNEYCKVVYLDRTEGVSSTELRSNNKLSLAYVGDNNVLCKFYKESKFVNGIESVGILTKNLEYIKSKLPDAYYFNNLDELISSTDAVYILGTLDTHYEMIKRCLENKKSVLCETPIVKDLKQYKELFEIAKRNNVILMDSIKTAYAMAYHRLLLLIKGGIIGNIVAVDATCTSMRKSSDKEIGNEAWSSILKWGPTALLPVFDILGTNYNSKRIVTSLYDNQLGNDKYTNIYFEYPNAVGNIKVGKGIKSEGNLVITGTKGCIFVEAPWWKTDYFEIHFENQEDNRKYFYQLDGEGIRNELVQFLNNIYSDIHVTNVDKSVSEAIVKVMEDYYNEVDLKRIDI